MPGLILKVLTCNIHHGRDLKDRDSLPRLAALITASGAHLVALQEVESGSPRSAFVHQPHRLARLSGLQVFFAPALRLLAWHYGNCLGSLLPVERKKRFTLPGTRREKRNLLLLRLKAGPPFYFLGTHLGLSASERAAQAFYIADRLAELDAPFILGGDFNAPPFAPELLPLQRVARTSPATLPTYPAEKPHQCLDFFFFSPHWQLIGCRTIPTRASDHLPLLGEFKLKTI
ncbi:MAG: endonuclease/exonuclease/phosphatase family protein [Desulfurispora sp.]|uniref:endonuclease/exonuclease/phosphatase family protein n=1 Tax=Desulfurispora sp. TaxID=3014275 RepID=UPI00404B5314